MWFKNLQVYRLPAPWDIGLDTLNEQLQRQAFHPCGSQDGETRGWIAPAESDLLVHQVAGQWLVALGVEQRLLPTSVIRQEAADRAVELEAKQGYRPGRKQMQELRELIRQEFLPRAFTRRKKVYAWIDPKNGWLAVDAPSPVRAEDVIEALRNCLDSLPLALLRTRQSTTAMMSQWLLGDDAPAGFTIDQDCELRSFTDNKSAVRYVRHNLESEEIRKHIADGKVPTRLALTFEDRISFILTDKFEIKRLDYLDLLTESMDKVDSQDAQAVFDAGFALMTAELQRLLPALLEAMGGEEKTSA